MRGCNFSVAKGSWQVMRVWEALCFSRKRFPHVSGRAMSMESWVQSLDQPGCGILQSLVRDERKSGGGVFCKTQRSAAFNAFLSSSNKSRCMHLFCLRESCNKPITVWTFPLHTGTWAELQPLASLSAFPIYDCVNLSLFMVSAKSKIWPGGSKSVKLVPFLCR